MKARIRIGFAVAALLVTRAAFAHGGMDHVMGTVKAVDDKSLTVTTKDGKDVTFSLGEMTTYEKNGAKATAKDVTVGERVAVHAMKMSGAMMAHVVKLGAPAKADAMKGDVKGDMKGTTKKGHAHDVAAPAPKASEPK